MPEERFTLIVKPSNGKQLELRAMKEVDGTDINYCYGNPHLYHKSCVH